jgi:serine/threonine-protein kinase
MSLASVAAFLDTLRQCPLLELSRVQALEHEWLPRLHEPPQPLIDVLLEEDQLTPYQVQMLQAGRGRDLLLGQYVLLERLGGGGMGQVYKARHRLLQRIDALKTIRPERLGDSEAVQRFQREARAAAQLRHRNIVLIYDADDVAGVHFLAMEFIEGVDLDRLVKRQGRLPPLEACDYIFQAAQGLQHAFEQGLVHRDIKPHNLLVTADGTMVKILDFGLARFASEIGGLTEVNSTMGTVDYIAPEQIRDARTADIRADIYSLGCTLYHLLAGHPPFADRPWFQKLNDHQHVEPEPIDSLRDDLPDGLTDALQRMMAKDREARYQTPAELSEALLPVLEGGTELEQKTREEIDWPPSPPPAPPPRPPRPLLSWPRLIAGALLGGAVLGLVLAWLNPDWITPAPPREDADWGPAFTNSIGMELVRIEPGTFLMGSPSKEEGRPNEPEEDDDEVQHEVQLTKAFYLGAREVTQKQYQTIMGYNPSNSVPVADKNGVVRGTDDCPVVKVNWFDAQDFCRKLSNRAPEREQGRHYRLPTEAEWEFACRAGSQTPFACPRAEQLPEYAWYDGVRLRPVGLKRANPWGLFDMHGNAREWCQDHYVKKLAGTPAADSVVREEIGKEGVFRGGAYDSPARECRSAARAHGPMDLREPNIGFRVVCVYLNPSGAEVHR